MNNLTEFRITGKHRQRLALVYARQSDPDQVRHNQESTRLQYGLKQRAISFGWLDPIVIDDDLGISAAGFAHRPGFQRMLNMVTERQVGIILCLDATRLSRNSKDWAHLFELASHFDTLIADIEQVYDLSLPNDRMLLNIKGTIAEHELGTLRLRLKVAAAEKAARGELKFILPPGYTHDHNDKIVFDPDLRVQQAISMLFELFEQFSSLKQMVAHYRDASIEFPIRKVRGHAPIVWQVPTYSALKKLLDHPIYTGAYVYGRRKEFVEYKDGRLIKRQGATVPPEQADVFIRDHHQAYMSWEQFERNRTKLSNNRPRWAMQQNIGAARDGVALLTGLLRCGHCGHLLGVNYRRNNTALYVCRKGHEGERACISFGSKAIDKQVCKQLIEAVAPVGIKAAQQVFDHGLDQHKRELEHAELQLEAAQYEADRAFEQFNLVDPRNRLVVQSLEDRLNEELGVLQQAKSRVQELAQGYQPMTAEQRSMLEQLAQDLPKVWDHPQADPKLKKQILRAALTEIVVEHNKEHQSIEALLHWKGGVHTRIEVAKRSTPKGSKADPSLVELVGKLADELEDGEIARILNMKKVTTPRGLRWNQDRVRNFRVSHKLRQGEMGREPDMLTLQQVREYLGISTNGVLGLVRHGVIDPNQITDFAPWRVRRAQVDSAKVQVMVGHLKKHGRLPTLRPDSDTQLSFLGPDSGKETQAEVTPEGGTFPAKALEPRQKDSTQSKAFVHQLSGKTHKDSG